MFKLTQGENAALPMGKVAVLHFPPGKVAVLHFPTGKSGPTFTAPS